MKKILTFLLILLVSTSLFAVNYSLTTDFAYYPKSDPVGTTKDFNFAPINGPYSALEFRTTLNGSHVIPIPGDGILTSGNNIKLNGSFELSPVSIKPGFSVTYTPLALLNVQAGANILTGWFLPGLNVQGVGLWDGTKYVSKDLNAVVHEVWAQATLQFDLAAVMPGDWNHVVTLNTFKLSHTGLSGKEAANGTAWLLQGSGEKVNGFKYNANFTFGYQMPLLLNMVGAQVILNGYLGDAYKEYKALDGFMTTNICPTMIFKFNDQHNLALQFQFTTRPSYAVATKGSERLNNTLPVGSEMFFDRIALSYTVSF